STALSSIFSLSLHDALPIFLAVVYSLGLGLPFILLALGFSRGMKRLAFFRTHRVFIMRAGGIMLILLGLTMVTGLWNEWVNQDQDRKSTRLNSSHVSISYAV